MSPAPASITSVTSAERRQLTVMFCDLVGSTGLSARLDPEDLRELIAVYRTRVGEAVARFDGSVAQWLGDGLLAYFGYPEAHEDDPERAIRAGLAATAAVDGLETRAGARLQARVGIATGLVVVGEQIGAGDSQERVAVGETPNLAARLQSAAAPGEVVIAASTKRLVGRMFECRALGAIDVKGLQQPLEAWQVRGEAAGISRFEARRAGALTPMVGRQEEIEVLLRRWDQAKAGEGRVVLITGEPGIGKSRIAESLLVQLQGEPHLRLRYFCSPHHTHSALFPFISQLERAAGFEPGSSAGARHDKLEAVLKPAARNVAQDVALVAELLAMPADRRYPALQVSPQQKREMMLAALLGQLEGLAARKPVLIVFEDAHWIDPTSLDLLDRTVARVPEMPVLLIVTLRPELQPTWVGQPHVTMLHLSRLGRRDGASIIAGVTRGKELPDEVAEQILARTDGVPLFIEELTSTLIEGGLLRETADRYLLDGPLPPLAIPATLQALLVARFDRLASVKDVAQIGAAIGREFSHELIAAVAALPQQELDAALERLTTSGFVSRRGASPDATYTFKHAMVRDAAYATLLKSRRQHLHARIAKLLVERFPTTVENLPEIVAHHFTEAALASEAIGYWRKAGQLGSRRSANREAVKFFELSLSVLEALPESRETLEQAFDIRLELRTVLNLLGEVGQMLNRLREAEALAERLNDDRRRGQIGAFMINVHTNLGEFDEAVAAGNRALAIAGRLGDLRLRILSTSYLVQAHSDRGDYQRAVELAIENVAALPPAWVNEFFGRPAPVSVFDLYYLVTGLAELGRFAEAASYEAKALRLTEPMRLAFNSLGLAYYAASTLHLLRGDWATAQSLIERVIAVLREGKIVILLPHAIATAAWIVAQGGAAKAGLDLLRESEQMLERNAKRGIVGQRGRTYRVLGHASLMLGMRDEAKRLGELAAQYSQHQPGYAAHALHLLGDIASHPDRIDAEVGEAHYRQALVLAEPRDMRPLVAHCHLGLGRLYKRTGERGQAQEHLATATTMYREMDMHYWLQQAAAEE